MTWYVIRGLIVLHQLDHLVMANVCNAGHVACFQKSSASALNDAIATKGAYAMVVLDLVVAQGCSANKAFVVRVGRIVTVMAVYLLDQNHGWRLWTTTLTI